MTTLWKLTDQDWYTRRGFSNKTKWGPGIQHTADLSRPAELCLPGVIHAYTSPLLAALMNPIYADLADPVLWRAEGDVAVSDGTKVGVRTLTTIEIVPLPEVTIEQRTRFAILCALEVYHEPQFVAWANAWLDGSGRDVAAAAAARAELTELWSETTAAFLAAETAVEAARAAEASAMTAQVADEAASLWRMALASQERAATEAARTGALAAAAAARNRSVDLAAIAEKATSEETVR